MDLVCDEWILFQFSEKNIYDIVNCHVEITKALEVLVRNYSCLASGYGFLHPSKFQQPQCHKSLSKQCTDTSNVAGKEQHVVVALFTKAIWVLLRMTLLYQSIF